MIISGKARIAGVIGWPIAHSRSPRLHNFWLEHYGIDGAYLPLAVNPDRLIQALRALPILGFRGVNVTIPHKETTMAAVDAVDPLARRVGAVNTVIVREDGTLFGTNTDVFGFIENLRQEAPQWEPAAGPAVVLGAGGAARGVCVALIDAGVTEIRLVNRTKSRADALASSLGGACRVSTFAWDNRQAALPDAALLVNTTALGMEGHEPLGLELGPLPSTAVVTDIVYVPLETPLLAKAKASELATVDGLGMLLHQARPGFASWFGVEPQVTPELRRFVLEDLS
ncbi:MAG: shikimate dehydrogenase [Rhodospirillaceae bacterium]|nr:shikimate dehydrogenase [Rhodospirillaceae bacterium]